MDRGERTWEVLSRDPRRALLGGVTTAEVAATARRGTGWGEAGTMDGPPSRAAGPGLGTRRATGALGLEGSGGARPVAAEVRGAASEVETTTTAPPGRGTETTGERRRRRSRDGHSTGLAARRSIGRSATEKDRERPAPAEGARRLICTPAMPAPPAGSRRGTRRGDGRAAPVERDRNRRRRTQGRRTPRGQTGGQALCPGTLAAPTGSTGRTDRRGGAGSAGGAPVVTPSTAAAVGRSSDRDRLAPRAPGAPRSVELDRRASASSAFFISSASSLEAPSFTALGAPSTISWPP